MTPRLLLTASNIAHPPLRSTVLDFVRGLGRGAIVTTAEFKLKERNRNAVLARETFLEGGIAQVEYFDFDARPGAELAGFDFVYLAGGNPFYLLRRARETGADAVLAATIASGRPVIASCGGALFLTCTLRVVRSFDSVIPDFGWGEREPLSAVPFTLLPHANRWRAHFSDYAARLADARKNCGCEIVELDDGEGLLVGDGQRQRIGQPHSASATQTQAAKANETARLGF